MNKNGLGGATPSIRVARPSGEVCGVELSSVRCAGYETQSAHTPVHGALPPTTTLIDDVPRHNLLSWRACPFPRLLLPLWRCLASFALPRAAGKRGADAVAVLSRHCCRRCAQRCCCCCWVLVQCWLACLLSFGSVVSCKGSWLALIVCLLTVHVVERICRLSLETTPSFPLSWLTFPLAALQYCRFCYCYCYCYCCYCCCCCCSYDLPHSHTRTLALN